MSYLLHIDTSTETGTVAVSGDGRVIASVTNAEARNHAGAINDMVKQVLAETNITLNDLAAISVCAGPGSYTGLRIGMATAKGFCYALDKPLQAHNRLELLAYHAHLRHGQKYGQYIVLMVARDKEYFLAIYNGNMQCLKGPAHIMEADLAGMINKKEKSYIITNAVENVIDALEIADTLVVSDMQTDVASWAHYAHEKYICNESVNLRDAEPFYLKQVYTHK